MSAMRARRRLAGAALPIAVAAVAAGCGTAQTTSQSVTSTASSPEAIAACRGPQLAATYARTDGATGHMEVTIALRNVSQGQSILR